MSIFGFNKIKPILELIEDKLRTKKEPPRIGAALLLVAANIALEHDFIFHVRVMYTL